MCDGSAANTGASGMGVVSVTKRSTHDRDRAQALVDAISVCTDIGEKPNPEWFLELRELITSLSKSYDEKRGVG